MGPLDVSLTKVATKSIGMLNSSNPIVQSTRSNNLFINKSSREGLVASLFELANQLTERFGRAGSTPNLIIV